MPARKFTVSKSDKEDIVRKYVDGLTAGAIGREYGVSGTSILKILRDSSVKMRIGNTHGLYPEDRDLKIIQMYNSGMTVKQISRELHTSSATIAEVKKKECLKHRYRPKCLTDAQEAEVAKLYLDGFGYEELYRKYNVTAIPIKNALTKFGINPRRGWAKYRTVEFVDRKNRKFIFKSTWELAYIKKLDEQSIDWGYEDVTYRWGERKESSYTPDIFIYRGGELHHLVEIHGWLDEPTKNRIINFRKNYPYLKYRLLGPGELSSMGLIEAKYRNHNQAKKVSEFSSIIGADSLGEVTKCPLA